ncbi:MAG: peptide chain release factor N(5)-glutamine methyltransferase [Myxococcota bacterium]
MTAEPQTVLDYLNVTTEHFKKYGVESPRLEAELLLAKVLGTNRVGLYVKYDMRLQAAEVAAFRELVKRRGRHEPIHYILGQREFWSLSFAVEDGVLIPRPDSEVLIEEIVQAMAARKDEALSVADVGTGTGCLAIALATELPQAKVWAGDIADVPLRLARANADALGVGARVEVVRARGLGELAALAGRRFDVVVSNPPYIRTADMAKLPPHVKKEPTLALHAGPEGLDVLRTLVADAPAALAPGGMLALEVSDQAQADQVMALCAQVGLSELRIRQDYAGLARAVVARRPEAV